MSDDFVKCPYCGAPIIVLVNTQSDAPKPIPPQPKSMNTTIEQYDDWKELRKWLARWFR